MNIEQYMIYIWLGIFIISIIIEACTFELVSIWFAIGAAVCIAFAFIPGLPFWGEIIIFLGVSLLCLLLLRPISSKTLKRKITKSNIDEIVGKKGKITKRITPLDHGEVKINDVIWTAISANDDETIEVDSIVKVVSVNGNKLYVQIDKTLSNKKEGK